MTSQTAKPARGALNREIVLRKAIEMADTGGLDGLSMRKVASALGVEAMSLYNHLTNKDDLLDGMTDLAVSEIAKPDAGGDWRAAMRTRCISARQVMLAHPWLAMLMVSRRNLGPAMLAYVEATLACLVGGGFTHIEADCVWNAVDSQVFGFVLQELNFPFAPDEFADAAAAYIEMIPPETYPHLNALTATVMTQAHDGLQSFTFGLDLILNGLEPGQVG